MTTPLLPFSNCVLLVDTEVSTSLDLETGLLDPVLQRQAHKAFLEKARAPRERETPGINSQVQWLEGWLTDPIRFASPVSVNFQATLLYGDTQFLPPSAIDLAANTILFDPVRGAEVSGAVRFWRGSEPSVVPSPLVESKIYFSTPSSLGTEIYSDSSLIDRVVLSDQGSGVFLASFQQTIAAKFRIVSSQSFYGSAGIGEIVIPIVGEEMLGYWEVQG